MQIFIHYFTILYNVTCGTWVITLTEETTVIKSCLRDLTLGYIVKRKFVFELSVNSLPNRLNSS